MPPRTANKRFSATVQRTNKAQQFKSQAFVTPQQKAAGVGSHTYHTNQASVPFLALTIHFGFDFLLIHF